ncbi:MAG: SipW-dependent-type signal peptide-containing protein [Eggerthellaceae bacterium]
MSSSDATTQESNKRNRKTILLLLALALALVVGGTLAYLSTTTNTKGNVFTADSASASISASLFETAWDGSTISNTDPASDVDSNDSYGINIAKKMLPGTVAPKNPVIGNTSAAGGESEYVAMRVKFYKSDSSGSFTEMSLDETNSLLEKLAVYDGSTLPSTGGITQDSNWVADSGNSTSAVKYFYYNTSIAANGGTTSALFDNVGIVSSADSTYMTWLTTNCPKGYKIEVDGAAVQASGFSDYTAAEETLKGLFS